MRIYESLHPSIELPRVSVTNYVLQHAERLGDKTAFIEGPTGRRLGYGELADQIRRLAGGLAQRGVGPGTTWALMAPNCPEYAVVFHGVAYAGATLTTLNPTYGVDELAFQLRDARARAVVTTAATLESARGAAAAADIDLVVLIDGPSRPEQGVIALDALMGAPLSQQVPVDLDEHVVVLPYSSGTTGFPKGVMLTHHNVVANLAQTTAAREMTEDEVVFAVLPFFHIYGMTVLMNMALAQGATLVTEPRFDLEQMLGNIQTHRVTWLPLVPPIVLALAKHPLVAEYDLSSLRSVMSGAAPLGSDLADEAGRRVNCTIKQGYGMTELSPVSHIVGDREAPPGSVGYLVPNTEARIVDPGSGEDAPQGERGELWLRGPQVMKGYLANPGATAQTITDDGWLRTGDVAVVDKDGCFFIVDRLKELIKHKGFQVAPAELEALILTMPDVQDVAVIGVPDAEAGERVKAFIVPAPGATVRGEDVQSFVAERVSSYKRVSLVESIDAIPKSASGKILRRELRNRA